MTDKPIESVEDTKTSFFDEDGIYRIKRLFREVKNGEESGEAGLVFKSWYYSLVCGGLYGSTIGIKPIYHDFKQRFNELQFQNKSAYARKLADCTISACGRNGMKFAWRASLLSTFFSSTTLCFAVYHNDIRFTDMVFAFALTGGFYTFHRGPKAMLAGATLTGLMGLPAAGIAKLLFWSANTSYAEMSEKARQIYEPPSVNRMRKAQEREHRMRQLSVDFIDDYKSYLYHQRRVERLEEIGIVDDSFENLKPVKAKHPNNLKIV